MLNLKQVLDDAKTYADGLEFTIGENKVTLGELRTARAQMEDEHKKKMKAADDKFGEVTDLAAKAAAIKLDLEKQLEAATKAGSGKSKGSEDDEEFADSPFWAPVRKAYDSKLQGFEAAMKEYGDTIKKLSVAMERATTIWAEERWRNQFERLRHRLAKVEKHKNMTYEEVRDYAAKERILDAHGLPSVEKAVLQLTSEYEREIERNEAYERGKREGEMRARLGASGRPTSASGPKKPEKSEIAERGLEALGDEVAKDKELSEMLANLGAVDPSDFGGAPS